MPVYLRFLALVGIAVVLITLEIILPSFFGHCGWELRHLLPFAIAVFPEEFPWQFQMVCCLPCYQCLSNCVVAQVNYVEASLLQRMSRC